MESETDLDFGQALQHLISGVRMAARFMPENIFIELQVPDAGSMNTEPYLKMVTMTDTNDNGLLLVKPRVFKCEPWEPGRRSIFSKEWYTSKYQGMEL